MDEAALDAAAAAAAAEIAPVAARLGVYGLNLELLLAASVRAAAGVLIAHHDEECAGGHAARVDELEGELFASRLLYEQAVDHARVLEAQRDELAGALLVAQAETVNAANRAGQLAEALAAIEALPYEGAEPPSRRVAREALA